jgi:hypothetical protein
MVTKRAKSEATEKLIVNFLSDDSNLETNNAWRNIGEQMAERIDNDFSNIVEVEHIGTSYDTLGDIVITTDDGSEVYIETKFVENGGSGTLANLWSDCLTDLGQLENTMSWDEFRELSNHDAWVNSHLNRFSYPSTLDLPEDNKSTRWDKASHLKDVIGWTRGSNTDTTAEEILEDPEITEDQRLAAEIILTITKLDRSERLKYIDLLQEKDQNNSIIKRFSILLILGVHTKKKIKEYSETPIEELHNETDQYIMYIGNRDDTTIRDMRPMDYISRLIDKEFSYRINVQDNSSLEIVTEWEDEEKPILSASLNWKNKFQGIQNPSVNIFSQDVLEQLEEEETEIPF